jgi:hypothetical protein
MQCRAKQRELFTAHGHDELRPRPPRPQQSRQALSSDRRRGNAEGLRRGLNSTELAILRMEDPCSAFSYA